MADLERSISLAGEGSMAVFDVQHSKRPENDRSSAEPTQESGRAKRNTQHTGDLTRIPLYAQAWGNLPPPWLRPGIPQQTPQEGEPLQRTTEPRQSKENTTGLPDTLKTGVELLSGLSMDDVHVHYNSSEPSKFQALAYTQGTEIHVGPGQEQHLAHEAWHVAQQKQGRVKPMLQAKGVAINDDQSLEQEASVMGTEAVTARSRAEQKNRSIALVQPKSLYTEKVAQYKKSDANSLHSATAQTRVVQFFGGMLGLAGHGQLAANTILYHGTTAPAFTHQHLAPAGPNPIHYEHPPMPAPPAWFALNVLFSLHAGVRGIAPGAFGTMRVLQYIAASAIDLMRFDNVPDLNAYLLEQHGQPAPLNGIVEALAIGFFAGVDGYWLDQDAVRNEPEVVLFQSGLNKLRLNMTFQPNITPMPHGALPGGGPVVPRHNVGGGAATYYHTGGPGTLL